VSPTTNRQFPLPLHLPAKLVTGIAGGILIVAMLVSAIFITDAQRVLSCRPYPGQNLDHWTSDSYDAAMVLITAIKQLIRSGQAVTRANVLDQVQHIHYVGVTGPISFDTNGDITHGVFSIYKAQAGNWDYLEQIST
jgi:ABC-type branched-subunit amino acid transport system substrate-binding protein